VPELQGEPEEVAVAKCKLAGEKVKFLALVTSFPSFPSLTPVPLVCSCTPLLSQKTPLYVSMLWADCPVCTCKWVQPPSEVAAALQHSFCVVLLVGCSKWFLEKTGLTGLNNLLAAYTDKSAYAQCIFTFCQGPGHKPIAFVGRCPVLTLTHLKSCPSTHVFACG
jgi:hypothetical protein